MAQLNPYLTLNGNCAEVMAFYKDALNAELTMQKVGDSPMATQDSSQNEKVMHAVLTKNGTVLLMASDMMGEEKVQQGNTVNLSVNCESKEEIESYFSKLSVGGSVGHALKDEFWGATYGDLQDKYGFRWMFNFQKTPMK